MKIKSEAKIGLIVLITILAVLWGINFLKGKNILNRSDVYYAVYDDVAGLDQSAGIFLNGYKVGLVNNVRFRKNNLQELVVSLAIDHEYLLPKGSVAELYSDVLGTTSIRIVPGNSSELYEFGDTLDSRVQAGMLDKLQDEILPITGKVEALVETADSLLSSVSSILDEQTAADLKESIRNLQSTSGKIDRELNPGGSLYATINNLQVLSNTLARNKSKLDTIFANFESISDSIAKSNIKHTINNLNSTLAGASDLMENINRGEGSLGQLATNDSLYVNLESALHHLDILLRDLNENPKRYVHFSIFGRKEKSE